MTTIMFLTPATRLRALAVLALTTCGALSTTACGSTDTQAAGPPGSSGSSPGPTGSSSGSPSATDSKVDSGTADSPDGGADATCCAAASDANANGGDSLDGGDSAAPLCVMDSKSTASQPGYVGDWTPGDYPSDFADAGTYLTISGVSGQMGQDRQYAVHVPKGYVADTPVPAVFCIHGFTQTAAFCNFDGVQWPDKGDQEGFVVIMPNGYMNSWNAGTCCGAAVQSGLDDVALMRAIFAEVGTHVNIDLRRVYATGFSNGGYMSYRLGCEASDLFVAVAPAEGAVGTADAGGIISLFAQTPNFTSCAPNTPVSVLDIHGSGDTIVFYADQAPSLAYFQIANGCSTSQQPAAGTPGGGDTTCVSFTGCPSCPQIEVTGCTVDGGGHCWFGSPDCATNAGALGNAIVGNNSNFMKNTDAIWNFFASHSR